MDLLFVALALLSDGPFPFATGPFIALSAQVARWLGTSPAVARIMTDVANGQSQRSSSAAEDVQFGWLLSSHPNASALYWDAALVNDIDDVVNRNRFLWHRRRCWPLRQRHARSRPWSPNPAGPGRHARPGSDSGAGGGGAGTG